MDYDKIEKQPTLPTVAFTEKDFDYDKPPKHFSEQSTARWPSELPPEAYKPEASRTDYIENIEARRQSSNVEYPKAVPLTRRQKYTKHLKRYWICYILLGIIALAIGLPIL
jgi:hypothetical protein